MGFFDTSPLARLALMAQQQAGIGGMSGMSGPTGPQPPQNPTFQGGGAPVQPSPFQQPDMQQDAPPQDSMPRPDVPRSQPSRLQQFGQGLLNTIAPQPGQAAQSLLGPDAIRQAQRQSLLALGATLLTQGGASARPINIGEALGHGLLASQQTYNTALTSGVNQALTAESRNALATERLATTDNIRAQQQLRVFDLANKQRLLALGPQYTAILNGVENMTPDDRKGAYHKAYALAEAQGDTSRMESIQKLFAAGGTAFTNSSDSGKDDDLEFRNMGGRSLALRKGTGEIVHDYGPAKPDTIHVDDGIDPYKLMVQDQSSVNKVAAPFIKASSDYNALQQALARPENANNPLEQYNLMFKFIQSRDNSVVRASEIALLNSGLPVDDQLRLWAEHKLSGQLLRPESVRRLVAIMGRETEGRRTGAATATQDARDRLRAHGVVNSAVDSALAPTAATQTTAPGLLGYRRGGLSETVKGLLTPKKP